MIVTCERIGALSKAWRARGFTVALTNGCFDLLHIGHLATIAHASQQADKLIVLVNDDASVRRMKGRGRPVIWAEQRALIVSVIRRVEAVAVFADGELASLIAEIAPDVLVKGEEYCDREIVGAHHAKRVAFTPMVPGFSTTRLVERLGGAG
jgi:D-beta-D-heptose 7-phosphate kinase/D-beta-D-heptose 1-phosphate adenosyltransferase